MNEPSIAQVDAAVRGVLNSLLGAGKRDATVFSGKLLSLVSLEGWSGEEIRVSPGTIITPLARDQLKNRGIVLKVVAEREVNRVANVGEWGFAMETESGVVEVVRRRLLAGDSSWSQVGITVKEAGQWVAQDANRGAAVLTHEASVACYFANQILGVRAATVGDAESISRAIRFLGVNLAVIEPSGKSIYQLIHMLQTFRRGGAPSFPGPLQVKENSHANRRGDRANHAHPHPSEFTQRPIRGRGAHDPVGARGGFFDEG